MHRDKKSWGHRFFFL